jgi:predicted RNA-binding protein (TIGR00451 family)
MSTKWKVKGRKPVRHKRLKGLITRLTDILGIDPAVEDSFLETANYGPWTLLIVDRKPVAIEVPRPEDLSTEEAPADEMLAFSTLRGVLHWDVSVRWCAVDAGAIPFLLNGADCMGAGIHLADPAVQRGDLVWIRDQRHGKPLALGWALVSGDEMVDMEKGKAVRTIHWVGDELWNIDM